MNLIFEKMESKTVELKERLPQKNQLVKTCVAFANGAGGEIVIGVEDTTLKIVGVSQELRDYIFSEFANSLNEMISPALLPHIFEKSVGPLILIYIKVYPGARCPYFVKSEGLRKGVYIRVGSSTRRASLEMIEELKRRRKHEFFDETPTDIPYDQLHDGLIDSFYGHQDYKVEDLVQDKIVVPSIHDSEFFVATYAGVLFFLGRPDQVIGDALITCSKCSSNRKRTVYSSIDLVGPLPVLVDEAVRLVTFWMKQAEVFSIPDDIIREMVVNALVHRKYFVTGAVMVDFFPDRLEILSPGFFPGVVNVENIGDGTVFLRNPTVARIASRFQYMQKMGKGIQNILEFCEKLKLRKPEFDEDGDFVRLKFHFEKGLRDDFDDFEKIVELGKKFREVRIKQVVERLRVSRNTATRRMNKLVDRKMFIRKGRGAGTVYIYQSENRNIG